MSYEFIWENTPDRIKKGHFLPVGAKQRGSFSGTDNESLYKENLKTQSEDWYYRTNIVEYKLNKHGYRTIEFDTVDWANSIVIFGCSNVFGVGLCEKDTLSSQLSRLTNTPVINMGIGASSIEYSFYNSVILNAHFPTPKAVIHLYSAIDRTTYYNKRNVTHYGAWDLQEDYMDLYAKDPAHAKVHAIMYQMIAKKLWSNKTKYYEASFFGDTAGCLNLNCIPCLDQARDLKHPGHMSMYKLAEQIRDSLSL